MRSTPRLVTASHYSCCTFQTVKETPGHFAAVPCSCNYTTYRPCLARLPLPMSLRPRAPLQQAVAHQAAPCSSPQSHLSRAAPGLAVLTAAPLGAEGCKKLAAWTAFRCRRRKHRCAPAGRRQSCPVGEVLSTLSRPSGQVERGELRRGKDVWMCCFHSLTGEAPSVG